MNLTKIPTAIRRYTECFVQSSSCLLGNKNIFVCFQLTIEKGDLMATELSISHLDRVIALNGGFPSPDSTNSFSVKTARRIDGSLLEQVTFSSKQSLNYHYIINSRSFLPRWRLMDLLHLNANCTDLQDYV